MTGMLYQRACLELAELGEYAGRLAAVVPAAASHHGRDLVEEAAHHAPQAHQLPQGRFEHRGELQQPQRVARRCGVEHDRAVVHRLDLGKKALKDLKVGWVHGAATVHTMSSAHILDWMSGENFGWKNFAALKPQSETIRQEKVLPGRLGQAASARTLLYNYDYLTHIKGCLPSAISHGNR